MPQRHALSIAGLCLFAILAFAIAIPAAERRERTRERQMPIPRTDQDYIVTRKATVKARVEPASPAHPETSKAPDDTFRLYGGPGLLEGQFQTAGGAPDPQGWISVDATERELHWSPSQLPARPFDGVFAAVAGADGSLIPGAPFLQESLGETVAYLGDINGDGWADLGALYRNLGGQERAALVYLGVEGGTPNPALAFAEPPEGLTHAFGQTIARAGDVNGDGFDDVLVGNPTTLQSSVSLYLGGPAPDTKRDEQFVDSAFVQELGHVVATAGDVDSDGNDDMLYAGRSASLGDFVTLQLGGSGTLGSTFTLREDAADRGFGSSVTAVGDVNGDGYDDILVGHPGESTNGAMTGRAYLYLGGFLSTPSANVVFTGMNPEDALGTAVAGPGDVNGDGYDDFVIGVPGHDVFGVQRGAAYLYFGGPTISTDPDFVLPGSGSGNRYGSVVAALGDLNHDGFADYLSADPLADSGGIDAGESFVVFGGATLGEFRFERFDGTSPGQELGARLVRAGNYNHTMGTALFLGHPASGPGGGATLFQPWPGSLPGNTWIRSGLESTPVEWVNDSGYGNDWDEVIHLYHDVDDPGSFVEADLHFYFDCSLETDFDSFRVEFMTAAGPVEAGSFSGTLIDQVFREGYGYAPSDYVINPETGNPAVHVRARVTTDGQVSDEDGFFSSSDGAVRLDHISLWIDDVLQSHATWEPTTTKAPAGDELFDGFNSGGWSGNRRFFFGDFAKLVSGFVDLDPARDNASPQWAFLDDGTPAVNDPLGLSTGGSFSPNWSYGVPSGAVVNYTGGVASQEPGIWNEIWSPVLTWDDPATTEDDAFVDAELSALVYRHLPLDNGLFYYWGVRSRAGGAWSAWSSDNFIFYGSDPEYVRVAFSLSGHVPGSSEEIQVRLGVRDGHALFGLAGDDATPSPLFDSVGVYKILESSFAATTPPGSAVEVELGDDVDLKFDSVDGAGTTTVVIQPTSPTPVSGFSLATDPVRYYDLSTDADWSGDVHVCIQYWDWELTIAESDLRIQHWQDTPSGPAWVDVTSAHDPVNNVICGTTSSLSPFVLVGSAAAVSAPVARLAAAVLHPPHPNPFNPRTSLAFTLDRSGEVRLQLFDARGRLVKELGEGRSFPAGTHRLVWDGTDRARTPVASGVYFARLLVDGRLAVTRQKLTLVR